MEENKPITVETFRIFLKVAWIFLKYGVKTDYLNFAESFDPELLRHRYYHLLMMLSNPEKVPITYNEKTIFLNEREFEKFLPDLIMFIKYIKFNSCDEFS